MYTERQLMALLNRPVTRQYLHQLRTGLSCKVNGKRYTYPPILIKNEDWYWFERFVMYNESAVKKINSIGQNNENKSCDSSQPDQAGSEEIIS